MKTLQLLISGLLLLSMNTHAFSQSTRIEIEQVFFKDSVEQEFENIQQVLILDISQAELRQIDSIHIHCTNQLAGNLLRHEVTINPEFGYVIKDQKSRNTIRQYLEKEISFAQAQAQIRRTKNDPEIRVHPMVFLDPENSRMFIKMIDRNSNKVSLRYEVEIEYKNGRIQQGVIDQISSMSTPLVSN